MDLKNIYLLWMDRNLFQLAIDITRECKLSKSRRQITIFGSLRFSLVTQADYSVEILWPIACWSIWGPFNWLQAASQMWPSPHICPGFVVGQSNPTLKFLPLSDCFCWSKERRIGWIHPNCQWETSHWMNEKKASGQSGQLQERPHLGICRMSGVATSCPPPLARWGLAAAKQRSCCSRLESVPHSLPSTVYTHPCP